MDQAKTTMGSQEYVQRLAALDLSDNAAISDFRAATQFNEVEPVPLGSHAGYDYVLISCPDPVPSDKSTMTPLDTMRQLAPYIRTYKRVAIPGAMAAAPDLQLGIGLGRLFYSASGAKPGEGYEDAGYYVLLNALDKSLWMTIDWYPPEGDGPYVPEDGDDWGRLPGDKHLQVGTMRISKAGVGDSNTDPMARWPALGCRLVSQPARQADVVLRLKKT